MLSLLKLSCIVLSLVKKSFNDLFLLKDISFYFFLSQRKSSFILFSLYLYSLKLFNCLFLFFLLLQRIHLYLIDDIISLKLQMSKFKSFRIKIFLDHAYLLFDLRNQGLFLFEIRFKSRLYVLIPLFINSFKIKRNLCIL